VLQENTQRAAAGQPSIELSKPSAFFFVEGTFYNDMRAAGAIDYSAPIRTYLAEHGVHAPPHPPPPNPSRRGKPMVTEYSVAKMEDTRFEDLWVRLGSAAPALYCHQGGCEHLVVFKDVRMYVPGGDPPCVDQYPFKLAASVVLAQYRECEACGVRVAKQVTYNDMQAPHTPFFWCDACYKLAHYDAGGKALDTNYQVFPYRHEYNVLARRKAEPPKGQPAQATESEPEQVSNYM
jgi:snRNA-activating protein complex subunit 3